MMNLLYKYDPITERIGKLDNELYIFEHGNSAPFAFRTPDSANLRLPSAGRTKLFEIGAFSLFKSDRGFYCLYEGQRKIAALILPLSEKSSDIQAEKRIKAYLLNAYRNDPLVISVRAVSESLGKLVADAAEFCGCLTDIIYDSDAADNFMYTNCFKNLNSELIALSLPIISLMYRRISALRGFNFKVTIKDSLPCMIFSAKIFSPSGGTHPDISVIPEYQVLSEHLDKDNLIIGARLKETDEITEDGERIYKFSIAICPQVFDPCDILRAPVWKEYAKSVLDGLDLDLEGKY